MTTSLRLTFHASERIQNRLGSLVTVQEVNAKISYTVLPQGRSYVEVKRVPFVEISDPDVKPDGIARGDQIVAVVDNDQSPRITTVILRKSWSKSPIYSNIIR
jgi:hypothetical protein